MKLTNAMRKHPKKTFIDQLQVYKMLRAGKCSVAIDPKAEDQIIEDVTYEDWLKQPTNH